MNTSTALIVASQSPVTIPPDRPSVHHHEQITAGQHFAAYDYDRQEWITGETARFLLAKQLREKLELLQSAGGHQYARHVGGNLGEMTARATAELARLEQLGLERVY